MTKRQAVSRALDLVQHAAGAENGIAVPYGSSDDVPAMVARWLDRMTAMWFVRGRRLHVTIDLGKYDPWARDWR